MISWADASRASQGSLRGGTGNDRITSSGAYSTSVVVYGDEGDDIIIMLEKDGRDAQAIDGGDGDDVLVGADHATVGTGAGLFGSELTWPPLSAGHRDAVPFVADAIRGEDRLVLAHGAPFVGRDPPLA